MIAPRRLASPLPFLVASALGAALVLSPGCGGGDNPARFAGTIELPKKEPSRVDSKDFVKGKARVQVGQN
jgi:hypothetical protein